VLLYEKADLRASLNFSKAYCVLTKEGLEGIREAGGEAEHSHRKDPGRCCVYERR
jgi:hypothetical protein